MNLAEKIMAIMEDVQYLAKDDSVEFGKTKYRALSEEKVTAIMRRELEKHNVIVYPIEQRWERTAQISHVDVKYRIVNVDDPQDYIEVVSCGDGADTQDKGAGKAMTYAYKYMWLRTFAIPTGEDPDKICSEELDAKQAAENAIISEKEQAYLRSLCEKKGYAAEDIFPNGLNLTANEYIIASKRLAQLPVKNNV